MEWAFGCVRSRSFKLADDVFALVPFLDLANHAPAPTCAFRLSQDRAVVEMVAVAAAQAGEEATISYTGPEGWVFFASLIAAVWWARAVLGLDVSCKARVGKAGCQRWVRNAWQARWLYRLYRRWQHCCAG